MIAVLLKTIAASMLLISTTTKANGVIDVGFTDEVETVSALFRAKGNYFVSAGNSYVGAGYGHKFEHGFAVMGYNFERDLFITGIVRPKDTQYEIDLTFRDDLQDTKPIIELGLNYYVWEKMALRVSSDFNQVFIGIRRSL